MGGGLSRYFHSPAEAGPLNTLDIGSRADDYGIYSPQKGAGLKGEVVVRRHLFCQASAQGRMLVMSTNRGYSSLRRREDEGGASLTHRSGQISDRRHLSVQLPPSTTSISERMWASLTQTPRGSRCPTSRRLFMRRSPWLVKASWREIGREKTGDVGRSRSSIEAISTCSRSSSRRYPLANFRFSQTRTGQEVSVPTNRSGPAEQRLSIIAPPSDGSCRAACKAQREFGQPAGEDEPAVKNMETDRRT